MDFSYGETAELVADSVRGLVQRLSKGADSSDFASALASNGFLDIDLADNDGIFQAAAAAQVLGAENAPLLLGDHLVARHVIREGDLQWIINRTESNEIAVGVGHLTSDTTAAVTALGPDPSVFLVADAQNRWRIVRLGAVLEQSASSFVDGLTPSGIVFAPDGVEEVLLSHDWHAVNLVLHAADMLGCARALLKRTIDYTQERIAFDHPIGSFQTIQHRLADSWVKLNAAEALLLFAEWRLQNAQPEERVWAEGAQALISEYAHEAAQLAIQFHGGIAITAELWVHRWVRRVMWLSVYNGSADSHYASVAKLASSGVPLTPALG